MNAKGISPYFLIILIVLAILLVAQILMPFLAALALAAAFATVLQPLYTRLRARTKGNNDLAAFSTLLITMIGILAPLSLIVVLIGWEVAKLYGSVADGSFAANSSELFRQILRMLPADLVGADYSEQVAGNLSSYVREALLWLSSHVTDAFSSIAGLLLNLFIFFIALFFFLRDGEAAKKAIIELSPLSDRDDEMVFERLSMAVNSVIRGNLLIAFIRGIFAAVGFFFFGVPNPVLWGIVAGLVGLIPGIGVVLVFAPAILYIFFLSGWLPALGLLIWGIFVVGLIDNALAPHFVGKGMQLHPLLVFLSIFGGMTFFGAAGIFLGPLAVSFLFALLTIYASPEKIGSV